MAESDPLVPEPDELEEDAINDLFGADPWLRFDLWSARVWECVEEARNLAKSGVEGPSESIIGHPVHAAFTGAQFAQEIAGWVNPLTAAGSGKIPAPAPPNSPAQAILAMLIDDDD